MRIMLLHNVTWRVSAVSFLFLRTDTGRTEPRAGALFISDTGQSRFHPMTPPPTQAAIDTMDDALLEELLQHARFDP